MWKKQILLTDRIKLLLISFSVNRYSLIFKTKPFNLLFTVFRKSLGKPGKMKTRWIQIKNKEMNKQINQ